LKNKLAVFDLDGTLFDTISCNYYAYQKALNESGYELSYDYYAEKCHSHNYKLFLPKIVGDDISLQERIHNRKNELYKTFLHTAKENTHLFNILIGLSKEYHIAIATTASRKNTEDILSRFGRLELFDLLVCGEDVSKTKPDPECYMKVMKHFCALAQDTIIFEDSDIGIQAALETGANVISICRF